ncbi:MAG TPA: glycosyltransferase, partial [Christiangramia sp.]|nr:glycosyltransferase [Christiangramia sp.]
TDRVFFPGKIPPENLYRLTAQCDIGLSLEEDLGMNYRFSLPNKIFDYIQARIPVLCSDLPEMGSLVNEFGIGQVCKSREPERLAEQILAMLTNRDLKLTWEKNLEKSAELLCWENEENKVIEIIDSLR